MKQLEHVLSRVRVRGDGGELTKLTERQFSVARALAQHTGSKDKEGVQRPAELGTQVSVKLLAQSSFKGGSTVSTGLAELEALQVITRRVSASPWATHVFTFHQLLIDAGKKSRPYIGEPLIFSAQKNAENLPVKNANICALKPLKTCVTASFESNLDTQYLGVQKLGGDFSAEHSPPAPGYPGGACEAVGASAAVPAPLGGRAVRAKRVFLPDPLPHREIILERTQFFNFLAKQGIEKFYLDAQARRLSSPLRKFAHVLLRIPVIVTADSGRS
jgi:hypothetical protein